MKKIYIFGQGGFAKEVAVLLHAINKKTPTYVLSGFLDIKPVEKQVKIGNESIEVFDEEIFLRNENLSDKCFCIGVGNPTILKKIKDKYADKLDFPNLLHPNVEGLFGCIEMGAGNILTAGCVFTLDIKIGSFNVFNLNTTVGHDTVIGSCNVFNPGVNLSGGVKIGDFNLIGTNAAVLQYLGLGNNNIIGAGAMMNTSIEDNKVAVGVPAKVIKDNS
jgi:sugar O-acyltransferase (sialic acid O-acetyltransferase NeuD family)